MSIQALTLFHVKNTLPETDSFYNDDKKGLKEPVKGARNGETHSLRATLTERYENLKGRSHIHSIIHSTYPCKASI